MWLLFTVTTTTVISMRIPTGRSWGDKITIRYVKEYEYFNPETGEIYGEDEDLSESNKPYRTRAKIYEDKAYEVAALVTVPGKISYRYYGADEFVMGADTFKRDSGTSDILYYAFDCEDDKVAQVEQWMQDFAGGGRLHVRL